MTSNTSNISKLPLEQSFASHPKAKFWSIKNSVKPEDVKLNSSKKYVFDCECGHEIEKEIRDIVRNRWCPFCSSSKLCDNKDCITCFNKSFASHPKAKYWDDNKNDLKPKDVFKTSNKNYYFICDCKHSFITSIRNVLNSVKCIYCNGQKLCDDNNCKPCFDKSFANDKKAIYWSNKNIVKPRNIFINTTQKYWFDCNCGKEFKVSIHNYSKYNAIGCECCSSKKLCADEKCKPCFETSFASHGKINCWSKKNIVNPRNIYKNTPDKYWFDCNICNHELFISLGHLENDKLHCIYCINQKLCDNKECKTCFEKSFASSDKAIYWSSKNNVEPRTVFKSSENKYFFKCNSCPHEFDMSLGKIKSGSWCRFCANFKLCKKEDCKTCFDKSFATSDKAIYWSSKNILKPSNVFIKTPSKYYFNCNKCNKEFNSSLSHVSAGGWCPHCNNKTEAKLYDLIIKIYPSLIQQYKVDWCKNEETKRILPFDFVIPEHKIIIELDGLQHFKQVAKWKTPEQAHIRDLYKMKCANDNSFSMIRILQDDVWLDKYKWIEQLQISIEKIKLEKKVQNIFLCKHDEYKIFNLN